MAVEDGGGQEFNFDDREGNVVDVRRLELLRNTGLLTVHHRPALDALTALAAQVAESPLAGLGLVTVDRVIFPSLSRPEGQSGKVTEVALAGSFCQYVVMNDAPLVVADAREHPELSTHPAVVEGVAVAYAGFPVRAPNGEALGALCVWDMVPRTWNSEQVTGLKGVVTAVETKIELRLSRRELHLDHERLIHVLDSAENTLIILADADGIILTMNRTATDSLQPVLHPRGATTTLADLARAGKPRDDPYGDLDEDAQDWILRQPDGHERTFSMRVTQLLDPDGEVDGWVVVGDDVSARRKTEELLRDTVRKQAEVVEQLEVIADERSTFIATASHELRTPVTSVLGYSEMLADGDYGALSSLQHAAANRVVRGGRRLQNLIEDLLSLDRLNSADVDLVRTGVDVPAFTQQAWEDIRVLLAGRDLQMTMQVPDSLPKASGDAIDLQRVLFNLLSNAVKFTPDGGAVRLLVQPDPQGAISFEVSDTGVGIPEEDQELVFEPFFRTDNAHKGAIQGAGIGLAMVRRIITSHGGGLSLTSTVDQGTSVRFTIPTHPAEQTGVVWVRGDPSPIVSRTHT